MSLSSLLNYLYPTRCAGCAVVTYDHDWCAICAPTLLTPESTCRTCGSESPIPDATECEVCRTQQWPVSRTWWGWEHGEAARAAIHRLKYGRRRWVGRALSDSFDVPEDVALDWDVVLPIPLSNRRLRSRGFNQSMVLARHVAQKLQVPVATDAIRRRHRPPQAKLTAAQRHRNIAGAFKIPHPADVLGQKILLVDDVATTGATLSACAKALKRAGALRVDAWTATREV